MDTSEATSAFVRAEIPPICHNLNQRTMIDNDPQLIEHFPTSVPSGDQLAALRIIDANLNRAGEGLRVVEEHCRFALGDRHLTERCKRLRHDLAATLRAIPREHLHAARQTQADVGTAVATPEEGVRGSLAHIAAANWQRALQALRVIEEYSKLVAPRVAAQIETLRYDAYTLAKACTTTADSHERLAHARLYVLLDGRSSECEFAERASELIAAGMHIIQLRDKRLNDRTLLARARLLRRLIDESVQEPGVRSQGSGVRSQGSGVRSQGSGARGEGIDVHSPTHHSPTRDSPLTSRPLLIVNDRPDLAVLARADGVHLGQDELSVHDARQIVGPDLLIGVSTHNLDQARQAVLDGASYLGCGPTFPSGTKEFDHFPGLDFLRQVAAEISLPAFAIGGITLENLPQVLATGIRRVAIGGAIATSYDPRTVVYDFLTTLGKSE
jgi:thiamine-phosphate pyrophosphorylase